MELLKNKKAVGIIVAIIAAVFGIGALGGDEEVEVPVEAIAPIVEEVEAPMVEEVEAPVLDIELEEIVEIIPAMMK